MKKEESFSKIKIKFPLAQVTAAEQGELITMVIEPSNLVPVAEFLKKDMGYDYLQFMTCVDRTDKLELQYHIYSYGHKGKVIIKTAAERTKGKIATVSTVWKTANWHEREAYDLFGVTFEGHPDLRRILLDDGFEGHPLLRDFAAKDFVKLPKL